MYTFVLTNTFVFVYHTHIKKLFCLIIIDKRLTIKVAAVMIFILQFGYARAFNLNFLQDSGHFISVCWGARVGKTRKYINLNEISMYYNK